MKINLTIEADYNTELYLHENSHKLKNSILDAIEQFTGKNTVIHYDYEYAQVDAAMGGLVNYNPYPIERQFNSEYDKEHQPLEKHIPIIVL